VHDVLCAVVSKNSIGFGHLPRGRAACSAASCTPPRPYRSTGPVIERGWSGAKIGSPTTASRPILKSERATSCGVAALCSGRQR